MKNIHVLSTEKPSRLGLCNNQLVFLPKDYSTTYQNIYITNSEQIKEGDWYLINGQSYSKYDGHFTLGIDCKKIILTTDVDLIVEGVQAIGDDFLEWFVDNPGCEEIEVEN